MSQSKSGSGSGGKSGGGGSSKQSAGVRPPPSGGDGPPPPPKKSSSQRRPQGQSAVGSRQGSTRPPVKGSTSAPPPSGMKAQVNRTLPPFSTQRYIAIWVGLLAVFGLVILALLWPTITGSKNSPSTANNSANGSTASGGVAPGTSVGGGAVAVSNPTVGTVSTGGAAGGAASGNCQAPSAAGKYMVIDTAKGCIVAKLYTDPSANMTKTIANFEQKANAGYFNGLIFHRVENWVIQGGDPTGTGSGGGSMPAEYNDLPFKAGSLGVARTGDKSIDNDSQFFITKTAYPSLNSLYTNFGEVVSGMDAASQIAIGDKINKISVVDKK